MWALLSAADPSTQRPSAVLPTPVLSRYCPKTNYEDENKFDSNSKDGDEDEDRFKYNSKTRMRTNLTPI